MLFILFCHLISAEQKQRASALFHLLVTPLALERAEPLALAGQIGASNSSTRKEIVFQNRLKK